MTTSKGNPTLDPIWERVSRSFDVWAERLGLHWCDIVLYRCDSRRADDEDCAADTDAKWQYRHASVRVYLPALANHTDDDIDGVMVHELVHILVNSMESSVPASKTDKCELAVENVSRAILDTYRSAVQPA